MTQCPNCEGPMKDYDGGEAANYEAQILTCEGCGHEIDLAQEAQLPEEERQPLRPYITVY